MNYENRWCAIAAKILTGNIDNAGLLNYDLINFLNEVAQNCKCVGGELVSRQVIALAVVTWQRIHPGVSAWDDK